MSALGHTLEGRARRLGLHRAARITLLGVGALGLARLMGLPPTWAWAWLALTPLIYALTRPSASRLARALDEAAGLDGALECAWDHRAAVTPLVEAQRLRALADLERSGVHLSRRPHAAWLLLILPWLWWGEAAPLRPTRAGREAVGGPMKTTARAAEPSPDADTPAAQPALEPATPDAGAQATPRPSAGRDGDPEAGGDAPNAEPDKSAGVGAGVGEGGHSAAGHIEVALPSPIDAQGGALEGGAQLSRLDAVADPARPYPARYHDVISNYFSKRRRP